MKKDLTRQVIHRYSPAGGIEKFEDVMIVEESFTLYVNNDYYRRVLCTPSHLDELVIGHLAQEGLINNYEDVHNLEFKGNEVYVSLSADSFSMKRQGKALPDITCPASDIVHLMKVHLNSSELHKLTGGVHVMSLAFEGRLILNREDIGRHNAVDKVFGYCLMNKMDCSDKVFFSSGRITHEIIQKLNNMGIRIVISRAAVTSLAREFAELAGITVAGFARGERFNIYSCPQRILTKE